MEHQKWEDFFAEGDGKTQAGREIAAAEVKANARAAVLLAARECPPDLIQWAKAHGIPTFAEVTWQAGFLAGMRAAALCEEVQS